MAEILEARAYRGGRMDDDEESEEEGYEECEEDGAPEEEWCECDEGGGADDGGSGDDEDDFDYEGEFQRMREEESRIGEADLDQGSKFCDTYIHNVSWGVIRYISVDELIPGESFLGIVKAPPVWAPPRSVDV
jgi:hypothetical protein